MLKNIAAVTILVFSILVSPIYASDIINDLSLQPIPVNKTSISVYFHYGNPVIGSKINEKSLSLYLEGDNFRIDKNNIFDLYHEQGTQIACNDTYSGKSYQVSPQIISNNSIPNYGPRTQNQLKSNLDSNYTGCLKVTLEIINKDKVGIVNKIIFNENALASNSYNQYNQPGQQITQLSLGVNPTCLDEQQPYHTKCQNICKNGYDLDQNGKCSTISEVCKIGEIYQNGKCNFKCDNTTEACSSQDIKSNKFIDVLLSCLILTLVVYIFYKIAKKKTI